jgi:hypothetical protein
MSASRSRASLCVSGRSPLAQCQIANIYFTNLFRCAVIGSADQALDEALMTTERSTTA